MTPPVRFGIVGAGMRGREHIRTSRLPPHARLTALADPTPSSLHEAPRNGRWAGAEPARVFCSGHGETLHQRDAFPAAVAGEGVIQVTAEDGLRGRRRNQRARKTGRRGGRAWVLTTAGASMLPKVLFGTHP